MNEKEIKNLRVNNELIAEFEERNSIVESGKPKLYLVTDMWLTKDISIMTQNNYILAEEIPYNCSWEFLMPVVEKIKNLANNIFDLNFESDALITSVYNNVVEFLKSYNK